jgi:hypothetical protein
MGIEPHFNMWNHFFHVQLLPGSGAEATILGCVDIYVKSGHGVDPYFHLSTPGSADGWQKVWFFFRNDVDASFPAFICRCLIPQPS